MGSEEAPPTDGRCNIGGATAAVKHVTNINSIPDVEMHGSWKANECFRFFFTTVCFLLIHEAFLKF